MTEFDVSPVDELAAPELDRRTFLIGSGRAALGLAFVSLLSACSGGEAHHGPESEDGSAHHKETFGLWNDHESIVRELKLTDRAYYIIPSATAEAVGSSGRFHKEKALLPIFPPSIQRFKEDITRAAQEFAIPVNVLASLATIESCGVINAHSGADAYGLVQVVPQFHLQRFVVMDYLPKKASYDDYKLALEGGHSRVRLDEYKKAFNNPVASLRAGAQFFAECIDQARSDQPSLNPHSMSIYGRAAANYNGGGESGKPFSKMPLESQLYVDHVSRLVLDIEVASRLKEHGYSDADILRAMQSQTANARAYAYGELKRIPTVGDYALSDSLLSHPKPGINPDTNTPDGTWGQQVHNNYNAYINHKVPAYKTPATPGLRIWINIGGYGLFSQTRRNLDWRI